MWQLYDGSPARLMWPYHRFFGPFVLLIISSSTPLGIRILGFIFGEKFSTAPYSVLQDRSNGLLVGSAVSSPQCDLPHFYDYPRISMTIKLSWKCLTHQPPEWHEQGTFAGNIPTLLETITLPADAFPWHNFPITFIVSLDIIEV